MASVMYFEVEFKTDFFMEVAITYVYSTQFINQWH
jgi:hypothetical protein